MLLVLFLLYIVLIHNNGDFFGDLRLRVYQVIITSKES